MKILLADDHGLFRDSMAVWLKQLDNNVDIEFASDWAGLNEQLNNTLDLVMLDLGMPGMFGATSICELVKRFPALPVLVVSANEDQHTIDACLTCGAAGYITKASDGQEILKAVANVLDGDLYQPQISAGSEMPLSTEKFSRKQFELLACLAKGDSNKTIAENMHLAEGTIKQYVSQLLTILEVDNRTQAGNKARKILGF
ncbi:MAG: DNA-binding response regulator [Methylophaga sp.]|nr:MAG: DNA-binding response regulator [Methylophaga sp.]